LASLAAAFGLKNIKNFFQVLDSSKRIRLPPDEAAQAGAKQNQALGASIVSLSPNLSTEFVGKP
jgi:hypothetical protein